MVRLTYGLHRRAQLRSLPREPSPSHAAESSEWTLWWGCQAKVSTDYSQPRASIMQQAETKARESTPIGNLKLVGTCRVWSNGWAALSGIRRLESVEDLGSRTCDQNCNDETIYQGRIEMRNSSKHCDV